jgi:RNA polymerase sigma-70 factor (ECF subfamily)
MCDASRFAPARVDTVMDRERELHLVSRLGAGDADAFEQIHAEFNARLFNFLCRLSNSRDVAEDLLEETWLRLVKHSRRLQPETRLAAWLFTVARRVHVSYVRSRVLEDSAAVGLIALWPSAVARASPFEAAAASELERRIERALASIPLSSREALLLVAAAGLDHTDAAAVLGVTPEAFRQRLSRARASLARAIEKTPAGARVLREVLP